MLDAVQLLYSTSTGIRELSEGAVTELLALAQEVREAVHTRFGVWLEQEPRELGMMPEG